MNQPEVSRDGDAVEYSVMFSLACFSEGAVAGWGLSQWQDNRLTAIWLVALAIVILASTIRLYVRKMRASLR